MDVTISRRALLASAPAVVAIAATPGAASAIVASTPLDDAIAAHRRATAICDRWHTLFYDPAFDAFAAERDAVPHFTTELIDKTTGKPAISFSTSDMGMLGTARSIVRNSLGERETELTARCRELVEAADDRARQVKEIAGKHHIDEMNARSNKLTDAKIHAWWDVQHAPVRTLADMLRKIEFLKQTGTDFDDDELWGDWVLADLKRIEGGIA